jgi:hypothetical protein
MLHFTVLLLFYSSVSVRPQTADSTVKILLPFDLGRDPAAIKFD